MITIVDYGLGNINAFANIYKSLGINCCIARHKDDLRLASRLILPGVGSFDWAMHRLEASGFRCVLDELVLIHKVPVLGICVGMQMMANHSEEGTKPGLGWIPGVVKRFDCSVFTSNIYLPHMGWNDVTPVNHPLFANILDPRFYFLHSYYFQPASTDLLLAETTYASSFASSVYKENIFGVQFHPEKSHFWGVQLLKNFVDLKS